MSPVEVVAIIIGIFFSAGIIVGICLVTAIARGPRYVGAGDPPLGPAPPGPAPPEPDDRDEWNWPPSGR